MKPTPKIFTAPAFTTLALAAIFIYPPLTASAAGPAPVNLGSAAHFTILAGAAVTTTGGGIINGDVGASPITGAAILLTQPQVNGTIYETDASGPPGAVVAPGLLTTAKGDLTKAINDAAGRTPVPSGDFLNPGVGNMAGLTLVPGLYKFTGTASISGGDLTLSGGPDDVWIFQIATDLEVGTNANVILTNGAVARNIFWQVGTSATMGTFSTFKGTVLAAQAITMETTSSMDGRALAFSAGVTFNGDVGQIPSPTAPIFAAISRTNSDSVALEISTTPFFLVTLQASPSLSPANWQTIATNIPATSLWKYTNINTTAAQRFYRAFITSP